MGSKRRLKLSRPPPQIRPTLDCKLKSFADVARYVTARSGCDLQLLPKLIAIAESQIWLEKRRAILDQHIVEYLAAGRIEKASWERDQCASIKKCVAIIKRELRSQTKRSRTQLERKSNKPCV
jgi:hypothetical protein